nr:glycoside hydrolase family 16 protein [Vibrio cidicii]
MFTITCLTRLKPKGCVEKARKSPRILCLLSLLLSNTVYAGWEVQWIDTFEGEGVNWNNWTAQTQANYNNEVQCYTADDHSDQRNYDVSNGTLKIIARKERVNCPSLGGQSKSWTSGRLNSKDKREFLYGKLEARIRFHNLEKGTWPAFWMLEKPHCGTTHKRGWRQCSLASTRRWGNRCLGMVCAPARSLYHQLL